MWLHYDLRPWDKFFVAVKNPNIIKAGFFDYSDAERYIKQDSFKEYDFIFILINSDFYEITRNEMGEYYININSYPMNNFLPTDLSEIKIL